MGRSSVDHYVALDVERTATQSEIRAAYRRLSVRWHPDKNPDCEPCLDKFRGIAQAYAVLGEKTKRKIYDQTAGGSYETIPSITRTLTADNFDQLVTNADDIWLVQVYSDAVSASHHFAPYWEETAVELERHVKFGRINNLRDKDAVRRLPFKVQVFPTVFLWVPGNPVAIYPSVYNPSLASLRGFVLENFPDLVHVLNSPEALEAHLAPSNAHLGKLVVVTERSQPSLLLRAAAREFQWVFSVATVSIATVDATAGSPAWHVPPTGSSLMLFEPKPLGGHATHQPLKPVKVVPLPKRGSPHQIHKIFLAMQMHLVPFVHSRNVEELCRSNILHRVYCLLLVDPIDEDGETAAVAARLRLPVARRLLLTSRDAYLADNSASEKYAEEAALKPTEAEDADEAAEEQELLHVQLVRVQSATAGPFAGAPHHGAVSFFQRLQKSRLSDSASSFVLDLDGQRMSHGLAPTADVLSNLYHTMEAEVLPLSPLPAFCGGRSSMDNCLLDPKSTWWQDLLKKLTSASYTQLAVGSALAVGGALGSFYFGMSGAAALSVVSSVGIGWFSMGSRRTGRG
eukprot:GHVT01088067.1.p1 GENE.GHVT01088067.1~~GHVT01088067.1.p1  ORF type:complete len:570 (+),score=140.41 GHVT01088067.1:912-2621(+)